MEARLSDQPDREHDNPLKPVRTRDDVGKNLANGIVARFRRLCPTRVGGAISFDSFDFRQIRRYDVAINSIEFYRVLAALGAFLSI